MSTVLFPYATLPDAEPAVTVAAVRLDGALKPQVVNKENLNVSRHNNSSNWKRAELDVELTCQPDSVRSFETEYGAISAVAVANCLPTNARQTLRLTRSDVEVGRW